MISDKMWVDMNTLIFFLCFLLDDIGANNMPKHCPSNALHAYTVRGPCAQLFARFQVIHVKNLKVDRVVVIGISTTAHTIHAAIHTSEVD